MSLRVWWEQLAARERLLVSVAAILLPLALIVIVGVRPLMTSTKRTVEQVADKRSLLAELEQVASRLGPQRSMAGAAGPADAQSLVVLVDQTTRSHGLAPFLKRDEPDGTAGIRLRFENVPFDGLVEWLTEMQKTYQISATAASVDPGQDAGHVSCSLQLTRIPAA